MLFPTGLSLGYRLASFGGDGRGNRLGTGGVRHF